MVAEAAKGFDLKRFRSAAFAARTEAVPVPDLAEFFAGAAEAVWTVRGLTGHELGRVNEAVERNRNLTAIIDGIVAADARDKVEAVKAALGLGDGTPDDIARRIEILVLGSVDPAADREVVVRLCTWRPVEFMLLTNVIIRLTGQGGELKKKRPPSGETPA
jgi:hypothetical protein